MLVRIYLYTSAVLVALGLFLTCFGLAVQPTKTKYGYVNNYIHKSIIIINMFHHQKKIKFYFAFGFAPIHIEII